MRVIERIPVAWSPYAVTFSHDGTRLAIGGGGWYGAGGITLIDLRTRERADHPMGRIERSWRSSDRRITDQTTQRSVSGLAFTSDDSCVMVSTWTSGIRRGAAILFEVDRLQLEQLSAQVFREPLTGIHIHRAGAVIRLWNERAEQSLNTLSWRMHATEPPRSELTNQRVAVMRGHAITGNHGTHAGAAAPPLDAGLIVRPLASSSISVVDAPTAKVTALAARGDTLITGSAHGELAQWRWEKGPVFERALGQIATTRDDATALWAHYQYTAVTGICALSDGRGIAVTAGNTLATWDPTLENVPLGVPGTARCIAASPDRTLIAVGIKCNREREDSSVLLIEVEPDDVTAWRTPRTREVAIAAHHARLGNGTFDPESLGVLADTLEELGCAPRVLHHLRTHDHRLRTCWVVEGLYS